MSNLCPSPATRFPVNRKDHTKKGPYLASILKKMLKKKITFESPETQQLIKGTVADALLWRLILNGTQGETHAIKEVIDRIDGKGVEVFIDQSETTNVYPQKTLIFRDMKEEDADEIAGTQNSGTDDIHAAEGPASNRVSEQV
jgi:hypothetical protein